MSLLVLFIVAALLIVAALVAGLVRKLTKPPRRTYGVALASDLPLAPGDLGLAGVELSLQLPEAAGDGGMGYASPGWRVEGGDPAGPVVVVTHGYGDARYGALQWAGVLRAAASAVVVYDLRGHGDSAAPTFHGGLTEPRDLVAILDQLDAARVVLFGYSLGAGVSIVAAALDAEAGRSRVVGVIADGPYRHWDEPVRRLLRLRRWPAWPVVPLTYGVLRWRRPEMARFDRAAWAAKLRCPLLVLHAGEDELCPLESARAIASAAPRGSIEVFEGMSHLEPVGAQTQRYAEVVAAFVRGLE